MNYIEENGARALSENFKYILKLEKLFLSK